MALSVAPFRKRDGKEKRMASSWRWRKLNFDVFVTLDTNL
jgi:hypothetical protein